LNVLNPFTKDLSSELEQPVYAVSLSFETPSMRREPPSYQRRAVLVSARNLQDNLTQYHRAFHLRRELYRKPRKEALKQGLQAMF